MFFITGALLGVILSEIPIWGPIAAVLLIVVGALFIVEALVFLNILLNL